MKGFKALLPAALVGTDRSGELAGVFGQAAGGAVAALLAELQAQDGAAGEAGALLLRAAGVLAVCERAGFEPPAAPDSPLAQPAAPETRPALRLPAWQGWLRRVLGDAPRPLQHQALRTLAERGWRLPAPLLPAALELAAGDVALRPAVTGVLGEHGLWLAAQRPRWRAAIAAPAVASLEDWEHGPLAARAGWLRHERLSDAAAARDRLVQALPELGARERAELVAGLASGLSMDDEHLLESLLKDRAGDVRRIAGSLLQALPASRQAAWLGDQLAALLQRDPAAGWRLEAPAQAPAEAKAHLVEAVRPKHESLGERAWWLYQLVRLTPLPWWTAHTGLAPAELLAWAGQGDWQAALLRGWRDAVLATAEAAPQADWALALLQHWPAHLLGSDRSGVQALLPVAQREWLWRVRLAEGKGALSDLVSEILGACALHDRLSPDFAAPLADALARQLAEDQLGWGSFWRQSAPALCALLPDAALPRLAGLPRHDGQLPQLQDTLAQLDVVIGLRQALTTLPNASATP
ncbi:DUF5691 domain-containing protein [Eleftheria terrae]|uniref:DUF5691 domain-containing protein n=1 Tax=Eleftheria terrae TaxID=1597781 RepID=UPI00263A8004|nr:DUF5691 domain-containing protein [Eleftheria terrae]WKB53447.1 DUF5691 domain-containing protein [Eleftheria terrae]